MGLLRYFFNDPLAFLLFYALPLLYSVIIHEVAHGWVAWKMGDPTAKWMGRLTLNPLKHLDPLGTVMLFLVGFGWAKPVPVNISNIADRRKGLIFVSSAGIAANFLMAFTALLLFRLFATPPYGITAVLVGRLVEINITLAALNLIPIPPLDGSKILMGLAPGRIGYSLMRLEPYGFFIIIGLLYLGLLSPLINLFEVPLVSLIRILLP
jgi:Zn-dependent protease